MKLRDIAPYLIIVALVAYICTMKQEVQTITIPAHENSRVISAPQPISVADSKLSVELLSKFKQTKDTIIKEKLYREAVQERTYKEVLEDSVQTITVETTVIGAISDQIISYRTNPIKKELKSLKSSTNIYLGAFTRLSPVQNAVGVNMTLKHGKKLITLGYDTSKTISLGVSIKLF